MLFKLLLRIVLTALALLLMPQVVHGIVVNSFYTALVVAVLWGILNVTLRPILSILTLPINILTLGFFSFILNAALFWFLASFVAGFAVGGFIPALEGSILLTLVSWVLHAVL